MKLPLGFPPAASRAERLTREALSHDPPELPGLAPGTVRRWGGQATWTPPDTVVLARHRSTTHEHWVVTNSRTPPKGYELEFDLGVVQRHEQPGTRMLVTHGGVFSLVDTSAAVVDDGRIRPLGHVEQAPFPMMNVLELRRVRATGQVVPVTATPDPLRGISDFVAALGFIEGFPIQPREFLARELPPWNLLRLIRVTNNARWRHEYDTTAWDASIDTAAALSLGSVWTGPGRGLVRLWCETGGRLVSERLRDTAVRRRCRSATARWMVAPLSWDHRPRLWALRATGSRGRHLATLSSGRLPLGPAPKLLGYIRAEAGPACSPLYSAVHPALDDQFVTRSTLEAGDMGYRVDGILGYICNLGASREPGPTQILWASRFGLRRRYREE